MIRRAATAVAALASLTGAPAGAVGPVQGLSCGLTSETVYGGPVVFTGEIAATTIYRCTVRVVTAAGATEQAASFESPGPVGLLPPTPVTIDANPATDRVEVCTLIDWVFGFPGGGSVDAGCREATFRSGPLGGYALQPEVIT